MEERHLTSDDEPGLPVDDDPGLPDDDVPGTRARPRLISVDELRAAGALDVPPAWRKSLGGERESYPLFPDDDLAPENPQPAPSDSEDDVEDDAADDVDDDSADTLWCEDSGA